MAVPVDIKEQVRQATDILELVGRYRELHREGRNWKVLCPWHDDHRPSLTINPERQSYKCWVCNEGGDVFSWVMKMEGVGFPEALRMLAERAGIEVKNIPGSSGASSDAKSRLYQVMDWAVEEFHRVLAHGPEGAAARKYLEERQVSAASIERFRLGFAPAEWTWLLQKATAKQFEPGLLESVGLAGRSQKGSHYDFFKGRLLFPIQDVQGRAVALGGRQLPGIDSVGKGKYINSPEGPLFSKSKLLYGLDLARMAIRETRTAVVMEGFTDVIMASQLGFSNAVAVLGTALTERHLHLLRGFADRVVLLLDGDNAGRRRANDILQLFLAQQMDLRVLTLPESQDPCDFLLRHGADALRQLVEAAPDALEHKFRTVIDAAAEHGGGAHAEHVAIEQMLEALATAPRLREGGSGSSRIREEQMLNRIASRFGVQEEVLRQRLSERRRTSRRPVQYESAPPPEPARDPAPWGRDLLEIILAAPELLPQIRREVPAGRLAGSPWFPFYECCCRLQDTGTVPSFERLLLEFDELDAKRQIVELDQAEREVGLDAQARLDGLLVRLGQLDLKEQAKATRAALSQRYDEAEQQQVLRKFLDEKRKRVLAREGDLFSRPAPEEG